jgi:hypothetical protein
MLSLLAILALAPAAVPETTAPAADEIVVTARHDKCFTEYAKHPVTDQQLVALSQSWAAGAPVRVIEPRGASIKCEFQIMQTLAKHGAHAAQFVPRVYDVAGVDPSPPPPAPTTPPAAPPPVSVALDQPAPMQRAAPVRRSRSNARTTVRAPSGIVTLVCTMQDPAKPYRLDVEVNEAKGTVTPSRPDTGGGSEMKAVFMPDAVRFGPFTLSRTTLRIQRVNGGYASQQVKEPPIVEGQCDVAEVDRVF